MIAGCLEKLVSPVPCGGRDGVSGQGLLQDGGRSEGFGLEEQCLRCE